MWVCVCLNSFLGLCESVRSKSTLARRISLKLSQSWKKSGVHKLYVGNWSGLCHCGHQLMQFKPRDARSIGCSQGIGSESVRSRLRDLLWAWIKEGSNPASSGWHLKVRLWKSMSAKCWNVCVVCHTGGIITRWECWRGEEQNHWLADGSHTICAHDK